MPHLIINPIKSEAYATAVTLGQTMFALYKPFDGPERLMRVASGQSHDQQVTRPSMTCFCVTSRPTILWQFLIQYPVINYAWTFHSS